MEELVMPAAELGPENSLPALSGPVDLHSAVQAASDIPKEDQRYVGYGNVPGCLPYRMQDGYRRVLRPRTFRVAVLENEILRATFLLELGGRLRSLLHKPSGRELLAVNPVLQPANLAIRNAWFSGGVEWNVGLIGHSPFTCAPLFAARGAGPGGTPVLRLYEWERIRRVPFQIDAYLPDGSPVLFLHVRITNPNRTEVPMYWWSNIAVPETADTRVVVPADHAYRLGGGGLERVEIPVLEGQDVTYTARAPHGTDYFFRIPEGQPPWIAALDGTGRGLVQTSTDRLKGRKLFLWGQSPGGRRWQEFLSRPGHSYLEIQAGLATTQAEHLPMPAGAEWSWLEAYGLVEAGPAVVHGSNWGAAWRAVEAGLEAMIPRAHLEQEFARSKETADRSPQEIIQHGSGWGALERLRREAAGEPAMCSPALVFPEQSLAREQQAWLCLLREGRLPPGDPETGPESFLVQPEWRTLLETRIREHDAGHWLAWLHLGVMRGYAGDLDSAREAFNTSLASRRTVWALRNLALLAWIEGRMAEAADLMEGALRLRPDLLQAAVECGRLLIEAGQPKRWLEMLPWLPAPVRKTGRIIAIEGQAALRAGCLKRVEEILAAPPTVADMREGEVSLTDLWFGLHEQRLSMVERRPVDEDLKARVRREFPSPPEIDFRMST